MAKKYKSPPPMTINPKKLYVAVINTQRGEMTANLFAEVAPTTVNNFVFLAQEGFYNDTTFHRVIENFMVQAGDPTGTGRGGPGYKFADERSALQLKHDGPGVLSMANSGPNTNGSQFFITHTATPWLDGKHGVFGMLSDEKSLDVLNRIRLRDPGSDPNPGDLLKSINILEFDA